MTPALAYRDTVPRPDDPDILLSIYADIIRGMPMRYAAVRAGITETTAYHWRMQGEADLASDDHKLLRELGPHALFVQTVKEAEAASIDDALTEWRSDKQGWARWATLLERRFPADFGRHDRVDQRTVSVSVTLTADALPSDALPALRDLLVRLSDEAPPALIEGTGTALDDSSPPG
jgi:hypothetical protein